MTAYCGLDLGLHGALVVLSAAGKLLAAHRMPLTSGVPDIAKAKAIAASLPRPLAVTCESPVKVKRRTQDGRMVDDSGFLALQHSRKFWAAAFGPKVKFTMVMPKVWQSAIISGVQGADTKAKSVRWASMFVPDLDLTPGLCRTSQDGLSDAAGIAEYGRRLALARAKVSGTGP